ncbi:L-lactate permease [Endozoicomonas sp. G2_2]|nr:L-lactate permease [Endozoicomonas sp. G2_2]
MPIIFALCAVGLSMKPAYAGTLALIVAVIIARVSFEAELGDLLAAEWAMKDVMLEVALIMLGGLWLNAVLQKYGVQCALGHALIDRMKHPKRALLLVVLGIVPFAESVTGFGVGAIVGIPLLRLLGLSPQRAAICGLLGLVSVPWGSLGPGTLVAARLTGIDFQALGVISALLSGPVIFILGMFSVLIGLGTQCLRTAWLDLFFSAGALWFGITVVNVTIGTPLAGVLGSAFAIGVLLTIARRDNTHPGLSPSWPTAALRPYALLIGGLLATHLLPVSKILGEWTPLVASPATWLLLTSVASPWLLNGEPPHRYWPSAYVLKQWQPVAITTILFLALGVVLSSSAMSQTMAQTAARFGWIYPAIAPWIGGLGGFLTGSNTGASAMFAASQAQVALAIDYPTGIMVGLQNVGASAVIMAAPPKVVMALNIAMASGDEDTQLDENKRVSTRTVMGYVLLADALVLASLSMIGLLSQ